MHTPILSTDLYELWMSMTYLESGMTDRAAYEFFVRSPLRHRSFLIAAGLESVLDYLQDFSLSEETLAPLSQIGLNPKRLKILNGLHFTGDVYAAPEGSVLFGDEPLLRVEAPIAEAQLIETALINLLQFQTLIASKAVRCVLAANGKPVIDFGLRRAHGSEAGLWAARASYISGFSGTSNVLAGIQFGIPVSGTMAHSFIQAHDDEAQAFRNFANHNPDNVVFLLDTYDTLAAAQKVCNWATDPNSKVHHLKGVRLDSGDLLSLSRQVRKLLNQNGLHHVKIIASGSLDEFQIQQLEKNFAPIDTYAVGTKVVVSADQPYLDCAYKLIEYAGKARFKLSAGKRLLAGRKQIFRIFDSNGKLSHDIVGTADEDLPGKPLLEMVMKNGVRLNPQTSLAQIRTRIQENLQSLPSELLGVEAAHWPCVQFSDQLLALSRKLETQMQNHSKRMSDISRPELR